MKKVLTLLAAALCITVANAQNVHQKDQYQKTFIQNTQRLPNQQLQASLRDGAAWENFRAEHGNWWVEFKEETGTPHRAFGAPIATTGVTASERAFNFIANELTEFNVNPADLRLISNHNSAKYYYVTYIQQYNGLDVMWSEATVRLNMNNQVMMFGMDIYNNIDISTIPAISADGIKTFAAADIALTVASVDVNNVPKILPIPGASGIEYKLIYEVTVNTTNGNGIPGKYYSLVDANNGTVYYRSNQVHECGAYMMAADLQADAAITDNPLVAEVNRGLPYLRVEIDGDYYYTDQSGHLSLNFISVPTPATVDLRGLYARVSEGTGATNIESVDITIFPGDNVIAFDEEWGSTPSEVSAYYWQNIVHDHMKSYFPDFTGLDVDQLIRVERNDGTCNAFYDGTSTNFYQDGGGCPATGLFNDVVMHEYGHGVNYDLYAGLGDPGGMNNGAMQEGYADLWGMTVTDNPILGQGFLGGAGTFVRRYDEDPKVYPVDLVGEVHADGEIIAGAWWDVNLNFGGDLTTMTALWMETLNATVDGAGGNEGEIYRDVLLEALIADDDNGNLDDGTPNDDLITSAFCLHGITLIGNISLDHAEYAEPVAALAPVVIETDLDVDYPEFIGGAKLFWRTTPGASYTESEMVEVGGTSYEAELPSQPVGTIIEYYFKIDDTNGCGGVTLPAKADQEVEPNLPYFALVGFSLIEFEDFDNEFGSWEVDPFETDDAVSGVWDVNEPIPSTDGSGYEIQTGEDHTEGSGNLCAFTGNAGEFDGVGTNDVDGGMTTLRSPYFDLTDYEDPVFTYYRRYSNASSTSANPGNDVWEVFITDNGGDDWVRVERTHTEDNTWRRNTVRVLDYVDNTEDVGFIFIAEDSVRTDDPGGFNGGSLVEAAVDDLFLYDLGTADTTTDTTTQSLNDLAIISGIFPNPANEVVNIFFGDISGSADLVLSNAIGEIILTERISVSSNSQHKINTAGLSQGIYTLTITNDGNIANKRVIIQH
jgi:Zn-dependent metalloprotease